MFKHSGVLLLHTEQFSFQRKHCGPYLLLVNSVSVGSCFIIVHLSHSLVQTLREHTSWVVNVYMQIHNQTRDIVSCSVAGDVRIWDPRFMKSVRSISASPSSVNACEIHPRSPLLACASPQHAIRVYNLESEDMLNNIRYHDGFMGQRIGPTKCLAFHPYKVS